MKESVAYYLKCLTFKPTMASLMKNAMTIDMISYNWLFHVNSVQRGCTRLWSTAACLARQTLGPLHRNLFWGLFLAILASPLKHDYRILAVLWMQSTMQT